MKVNTFTKYPKVGDIVVGDISNKATKYIALESFVYDSLDQNTYEIIGVVGKNYGKKVLIIYKEERSLEWNAWRTFKIELDNSLLGASTPRYITLRLLTTYNDYQTYTDYSIEFTASNIGQVKDAIKDAIKDIRITNGTTSFNPEYTAYINNEGSINIEWKFNFWGHYQMQLGANDVNAKLTDMCFTHIKEKSQALCRNGKMSGYGVAHYERYLRWLIVDGNGRALTSDITELTYSGDHPCKYQDYLGNSADGLDHAKFLRDYYGEGEEGYRNMVKAFCHVIPTDRGIEALEDDHAMTYTIGALRNGAGEYQSAMCNWVCNLSTSAIGAGEWFVPSMRRLIEINESIKYGLSGTNRSSDPINKGLELIKGNAFACNSYRCSCCRSGSTHAWISHGLGYASYGNLCYRHGVRPLALQNL